MSLLDSLTDSLLQAYTSKLSPQEQEDLIECLEVLATDAKYNKFGNIFPDQGEFSRDKYPRHMGFFEAGAKYTERAFLAANRCITPWTFISTPTGEKPSREVFASEDVDVLSWDGDQQCTSQASGGFLKCIEPAYRLVMEDGAFFDCTKGHRVLAESGWVSLDQLVSLSSGLRYWQTPEDYQANCVEDGYLCDPQLLSQEESGLTQLQAKADARRQCLTFSREDAAERISRCNHVYQPSDLLSNPDAQLRLSALYGQFLGAYVSQSVLQLSENSLSVQLFHLESSLKQALKQALQMKKDKLSLCDELRKFRDDAGISLSLSRLIAYDWQSPCSTVHLCSDGQLFHDGRYIATFFPFEHPPLVGGKKIIAIVPLGFQPIIDATVEKHKCYIAGGVVHHNTGKTQCGAYETTCHATGEYPWWWVGRRYTAPVLIWTGSKTSATSRDIIQDALLGEYHSLGSGLIPRDKIIKCEPKRGIPNAYEIITVQHKTGGISTIVLKTYEQGSDTWLGSAVDFIWVDEECPKDVYDEALIRLMTTNGSMITTFTPLNGMTEVVTAFLDNSQDTESKHPKHVTLCKWDDVPHLTDQMKQQMLSATSPHLRLARSEGDPTVSSGMIYPVNRDFITVDDFKIPVHWPKLYGMDVGWNNTAAIWGAWDRDTDTIYLYSEYKQGEEKPVVHSRAIEARGKWIKGAIDPNARGRSQIDGEALFRLYRLEGLKIFPADNSVETGIYEVWDRLSTGRLKVFKSLTKTLHEMSLYRRDLKGKIVKTNDHIMDAMRYMITSPASMWTLPSSQRPAQKVVQISDYAAAWS
jgi:phage terminase large subunit-like protein